VTGAPASTVVTPAIEVRDAKLAYRLTRNRVGTMKEFTIQLLRRQLEFEKLWALDGVSFDVRPGEVLGVVGPNGAGKSTLMKILARVLPPTEGRVIVRGSVAPMIELGAGFNGEMTAFENIILNGTLLGRTPEEMRERADDIAAWAGLTEFLDVPIRSYSTGMLARLGFSIATDFDPDILLVDEVLSVGDASFQRKSRDRIEALIAKGTAVVLVSHALNTVEEITKQTLWLEHGKVIALDDTPGVLREYRSRYEVED
jgi:ABC-2 type transport system ATP-binding protein